VWRPALSLSLSAKPLVWYPALFILRVVILLVGDQPISRYALAKILRKEGYEVTEAASTNEALELLQELLFQKLPIDLVITRNWRNGLD
jgi:PleD family two-component response regulator